MKAYTDLDTLYDTRYSTLLYIEGIDASTYCRRQSDEFKFIGRDTFRYIYSKRNRNVLLGARETHMLYVLLETIIEHKVEEVESGLSCDVTIDVNHYPYLLNDDDKSFLLNTFKEKGSSIVIKLIYKEPDDSILLEYDIISSYDGLQLLSNYVARGNYKQNILRHKTLLVPAIMEVGNHSAIDPEQYFSGIMNGCNTFINLQFINVDNYCNVELIYELNKRTEDERNR